MSYFIKLRAEQYWVDTFIDTETNLRWLDLDALPPGLTNQEKFDAPILSSYTIATKDDVDRLLISLPNPGMNFVSYAAMIGSNLYVGRYIMWGLWDDWTTPQMGYTWAYDDTVSWINNTNSNAMGTVWKGVGVWAYTRQEDTPIPEPTTIALLGIGLVGLAGADVRRRRKKKAVGRS